MVGMKIRYLFLALAFTVVVMVIVWLPPQSLAFLISDDAYYYFLTAHNIAKGLGSTFDGTNLTNGYHPQWMLLIVPIYYLIDDLDNALKGVVLIQFLLAVCSACFIYMLNKLKYGKNGAILSVILYITLFSPSVLMFNGLESGLFIFWIVFSFYLIERYDLLSPKATYSKTMLLGLLLAGMVTARLDSAFIVVALALLRSVFFIRNEKRNLIHLIKLYFPTYFVFFLLVAPYFIWNYVVFSHFTPISGAIKSTFPNIYSGNQLGLASLPFVVPFLFIFACILFLLLFNLREFSRTYVEKWRYSGKEMFGVSLAIGCMIHLIWTVLYMSFGVYQWHFVAYIPVIIYYVNYFLQRLPNLRVYRDQALMRNPILIASAVMAVLFNGVVSLDKGIHHADRIKAARWAYGNIAKDEAVAMSDAGAFAYFSSRRTVNLDGLINSYEFQENVKCGKLDLILKDNNIKYIADAFARCDEESDEIRLLSWQGENYRNPIGYTLEVLTKDAVYTGIPKVNRPISSKRKVCFRVWKIDDVKVKREGA
jgi:hypothetical protein